MGKYGPPKQFFYSKNLFLNISFLRAMHNLMRNKEKRMYNIRTVKYQNKSTTPQRKATVKLYYHYNTSLCV